jgi:hypothetical protein
LGASRDGRCPKQHDAGKRQDESRALSREQSGAHGSILG